MVNRRKIGNKKCLNKGINLVYCLAMSFLIRVIYCMLIGVYMGL